jgi:hypothetical protein
MLPNIFEHMPRPCIASLPEKELFLALNRKMLYYKKRLKPPLCYLIYSRNPSAAIPHLPQVVLLHIKLQSSHLPEAIKMEIPKQDGTIGSLYWDPTIKSPSPEEDFTMVSDVDSLSSFSSSSVQHIEDITAPNHEPISAAQPPLPSVQHIEDISAAARQTRDVIFAPPPSVQHIEDITAHHTEDVSVQPISDVSAQHAEAIKNGVLSRHCSLLTWRQIDLHAQCQSLRSMNEVLHTRITTLESCIATISDSKKVVEYYTVGLQDKYVQLLDHSEATKKQLLGVMSERASLSHTRITTLESVNSQLIEHSKKTEAQLRETKKQLGIMSERASQYNRLYASLQKLKDMRLEDKEKQLVEARKMCAEKERQLGKKEKERQLVEARKMYAEAQRMYVEMGRHIGEKNRQLVEARKMYTEKEREVVEARKMYTEKVMQVGEKKMQVQEKVMQVAEKERQLEEKESQLQETRKCWRAEIEEKKKQSAEAQKLWEGERFRGTAWVVLVSIAFFIVWVITINTMANSARP